MNSINEIFADLKYHHYALNRDAVPNITPQSWKKVYGPCVDEMESRYLAEKAILKAQSKETS